LAVSLSSSPIRKQTPVETEVIAAPLATDNGTFLVAAASSDTCLNCQNHNVMGDTGFCLQCFALFDGGNAHCGDGNTNCDAATMAVPAVAMPALALTVHNRFSAFSSGEEEEGSE
jgi:hypothetical protein